MVNKQLTELGPIVDIEHSFYESEENVHDSLQQNRLRTCVASKNDRIVRPGGASPLSQRHRAMETYLLQSSGWGKMAVWFRACSTAHENFPPTGRFTRPSFPLHSVKTIFGEDNWPIEKCSLTFIRKDQHLLYYATNSSRMAQLTRAV